MNKVMVTETTSFRIPNQIFGSQLVAISSFCIASGSSNGAGPNPNL
jgi:hypothetical protein